MNSSQTVAGARGRFWLPALVVLVAIGLRVAMWGHIPRTELISDEGEYLSAATWLAAGRGFDWYQGYLWTRAPLYPLFVALHIAVFPNPVDAVYGSQMVLSVVNVVLVYALAGALTALRSVQALAALATAVYLPFVMYPQALLSETLYITILLLTLLALLRAEAAHTIHWRRAWLWPAVAGALLGAATLTRSLTLGFVPLAAGWLFVSRVTNECSLRDRLARAAVLLCGFGVLLLPWTAYNSRLYGGVVLVDTSGAYNILLGARTAYDGQRSDAQVRDYVLGLLGQPQGAPVGNSCVPYPGVVPSQAARQAAMTREGLCLIAARPARFIQKSLAELIDMFQINYTGAERFTDGFSTGRLPSWYVLALFFLDDTLYVLALPLAVLGWFAARRPSAGSAQAALQASRMPFVSLVGLWWAYNLAVAPLLFAINRFRLPLLPLAFVFAAWFVVAGWPLARRQFMNLWMCAGAALAALLVLVAATPFAYFEPRAADQPSRWASYLGPYPSSIDITIKALEARPRWLADQQFYGSLAQNDLATAEALLASGSTGDTTARVGPALVAGRRGAYEQGLALLPAPDIIAQSKDVAAAVVRGDLLRSLGQTRAALDQLGARFVDDANPVDWAWDWLAPAPTADINIGGTLDLGYVRGCYLGEGDPEAGGNFRWCTDGMQLRFPGAGRAAPQILRLRVDGRAWRYYARTIPPAHVMLGEHELGVFAPNVDGVEQFVFTLPPTDAGSDVVITIRTPTFVPDAARYNSQQGRGVVGQVQRLGIRLDEARIEP